MKKKEALKLAVELVANSDKDELKKAQLAIDIAEKFMDWESKVYYPNNSNIS